MVFYDTPGLAPPEAKVEKSIALSPWVSIKDVDLVMFMWDISNPRSLSTVDTFIGRLEQSACPVYLILNKIDILRKGQLGEIEEQKRGLLKKHTHVQRSFAVSALRSKNLDAVKASEFA